MTTRGLLNILGRGLLVSAAMLGVLALIHHNTVAADVIFYDSLDNEVSFGPGASVTFLLWSLAGVAMLNGGILVLAARRIQP